MKTLDLNNYVQSDKVLVFPSSQVRKPPEDSVLRYPDGRRFSEYNIIQILNSLIDYDTLGSEGFVCDYTLNDAGTAITDCTLIIHGYIFRVTNENIELNANWYASIILQNVNKNSLVQETERVLRIVDAADGNSAYCQGLIFTNAQPNFDKDNNTLSGMNDPDPNGVILQGLIQEKMEIFTIPIYVDGKLNTHKFTSNSIKNIDGGTC